MNVGVAAGTRRQLRRSCTHPVNRAGRNGAMALVAKGVDLRHVQQAGILRTMRRVASQAAFGLDRGVLEDEWPARLGVALGANLILIGGRPEVVVPECAVWIMAVGAAHEPFIHLVMERHVEGRFYIGVALKAERGLRSFEQLLVARAGMHAVATGAANIGLGMRRTFEVGMRSGVTAEAGGVYLFGSGFGGVEDLAYIAAGINVGLARTMAGLARGTSFAMLQGQLAVRVVGESFCFRFMACGAYLRADKVRGIGIFGLHGGWLRTCISLGGRASLRSDADHACAKHQSETCPQHRQPSGDAARRQELAGPDGLP
jgi:hypothetical protein